MFSHHLLLSVSHLEGTQCPHRADEYKFFSGQSTLECPCVGVHWKMLFMSSDKPEFICFNQDGAISLNGKPLKLDRLIYFSSSISFTKSDVNIHRDKAWTASDMLLIIWKSNLSDEIKQDFLQGVAVSVWLDHLESNKTVGEKI